MTPDKRSQLESRRILLQQQQQAIDFVESRIRPFVEILQNLQQNEVPFNIVEIFNILPEWKMPLAKILSQHPFATFGLDKIAWVNESILIHQLLDRYPSANPFRYVPALPLMAGDASLSSILQNIDATPGSVYLSYFTYPFVLQIELAHLRHLDEAELFNAWHGDAVIFPNNMQWLIAYSLEEEWRFGKG